VNPAVGHEVNSVRVSSSDIKSEVLLVNKKSSQLWLSACLITLLLVSCAIAQTTAKQSDLSNAQLGPQNSHASATRSVAEQALVNSLSSLPEADTLVYISPQRILNDAAPKVMPAADITKMRSALDDVKKSTGVDLSKIDYFVIAVRFKKPAADLSFVPPDFMAVAGGDFSADSLLTLARGALQQQKTRDEKYGSKTLTLVTIDPIAQAAEKNPLLKSLVELGIVPLNANTVAIGTTAYLKAAVDAADGQGRISTESLNSLLRDPNALISAAGSPMGSFAKSFGLLGTEATPRESRCDTKLGDFYSALTMDATNFSLRGAMNADNPDTAKIINGLVSGLVQQAVSAVPDKNAQALMQGIKMMPKGSEVVWEADIPQQTVADFVREQMKPKPPPASVETSPPKTPKRAIRKRRGIHN
jgi:hypothetical protein